MNSANPNVRDWTPSAHCEPLLRVGIVLDEDGAQQITLTVVGDGFQIQSQNGIAQPLAAGDVVFHKDGDTVCCRAAEDLGQSHDPWTIVCANSVSSAKGNHIVARDVIAGRGFHWQKRCDQALPGRLEVRAGRNGLILINDVHLEPYLECVITSEMGGACPVEFLKAQCVVARSWLLAMSEQKHADQPFDRCNDDCCQRYHGLSDTSAAAIDAVSSTRGMVLLDSDGGVVDANYSKCCGGVSEKPEFVWGIGKPGISVVADAPPPSNLHQFRPVTESNLNAFLRGDWLNDTDAFCGPNVVKPEMFHRYLGRVDEVENYFRWQHSIRREALEDRLRSEVRELADLKELTDLTAGRRGPSGRASVLTVTYADGDGDTRKFEIESELAIRKVLSARFLFSSAFEIQVDRNLHGRIDMLTLWGAGWGHGVGFCQMGGLGMALKGYHCEQILTHYFPETRQATVYP